MEMVVDQENCGPLDLSCNSSRTKCLSPPLSPADIKQEYRDSSTPVDSDDSDGQLDHHLNPKNCKAYKKSLMRRYCEYMFLPY